MMQLKNMMCACLCLLATCFANAGMFSTSDWEQDDCTTKNSAAWCYLHAFDPKADENYGIKDMLFSGDYKMAEQSEALRMFGNGVRIGGTASIVAGSHTFLGLGGIGGASAFLMAMRDGSGPRLRNSTRVFFWLPTDVSKEDAEKKFARQVTDALKEIWGGTEVAVESNPEMNPSNYVRLIGAKCTQDPCALGMPGINEDSLFDLYNGNISFSVSKVDLPAFIGLKTAYASSSFYLQPALYTRTPKGGYFASEKTLSREEAQKLSAMLPSYAFIYYPGEAGTDNQIIPPVILNKGKPHYFVKQTSDTTKADIATNNTKQ